jgi:hypothetical protein
MEQKLIFGIIGSILLFVGVFTPIVSIPIVGSINYFNNGKGDGVIILVLSLVSFILVLSRVYKGLLFTGLGSLAVLIFTFINFYNKMNEVTAQMETELADNPFKGLADTAINSVQLQWGWAILVVGSILIITSSAIKSKKDVLTTSNDEDETNAPSLKCPRCNKEYHQKINYCTDCGEQLQKLCPNCSYYIPVNSNFCTNCGAQFS